MKISEKILILAFVTCASVLGACSRTAKDSRSGVGKSAVAVARTHLVAVPNCGGEFSCPNGLKCVTNPDKSLGGTVCRKDGP